MGPEEEAKAGWKKFTYVGYVGYARLMLDKVRCSLIKLETGRNTEKEAKAGWIKLNVRMLSDNKVRCS